MKSSVLAIALASAWASSAFAFPLYFECTSPSLQKTYTITTLERGAGDRYDTLSMVRANAVRDQPGQLLFDSEQLAEGGSKLTHFESDPSELFVHVPGELQIRSVGKFGADKEIRAVFYVNVNGTIIQDLKGYCLLAE